MSQGRGVAEYFEAVIAAGGPAKRAAAWMQQDVLRTLKEKQIEIQDFEISPNSLAELLKAIESGPLDTSRGREIFQTLLDNPKLDVKAIVSALGIVAVDDDEIESLCKELLLANPDVVKKVQAGNVKALGSLAGQAKKRNPNADLRMVQERCLAMIQSAHSG